MGFVQKMRLQRMIRAVFGHATQGVRDLPDAIPPAHAGWRLSPRARTGEGQNANRPAGEAGRLQNRVDGGEDQFFA